jgi:hypothetical protein
MFIENAREIGTDEKSSASDQLTRTAGKDEA